MNVEKLREMYPEGTKIILQEMQGESQMAKGLKGTVTHVDDAGQIHMRWENGSSLALNVEVDTFKKIEPEEKISVVLVEPLMKNVCSLSLDIPGVLFPANIHMPFRNHPSVKNAE